MSRLLDGWNPRTPAPVDYMEEGMQLWVEHGLEPGSFASALLKNDLRAAFERADENNTRHMRDWVVWCTMELPAQCWGSAEVVKAWAELGGIRGLRARRAQPEILKGNRDIYDPQMQVEAQEANIRG